VTDSLAQPTCAGSVAEERCPHRASLQPALWRRLSRLAGMLIPRRGRGKQPGARLVNQPEIGRKTRWKKTSNSEEIQRHDRFFNVFRSVPRPALGEELMPFLSSQNLRPAFSCQGDLGWLLKLPAHEGIQTLRDSSNDTRASPLCRRLHEESLKHRNHALTNSLKCDSTQPPYFGNQKRRMRRKELAGPRNTGHSEPADFKVPFRDRDGVIVAVGLACHLAENPVPSASVCYYDRRAKFRLREI